ncbi:dTDP-glucose 4,6-dehydratase [Candidatus Deianiraea vastatrix]|uniref:dTDP-glucose 4,6-dehydratase n=1 Tax=Candidatus Deianiraea vastatrix TaxID=2163644 RepID=A0A5B8XHV1_9RICK|nr:dTDP-glucose 4,6-dehydratase [Candidatus Deianiraea vastatrix]QED23347.1 dTDP-glucose 4,6-dehydratase 2 [Candidatus Deianiraea vastatrix]
MSKNALITGAAGFIGSNFAHMYLAKYPDSNIVVLDALTYAANLENLLEIKDKITFVKGDIGDKELVLKFLSENNIDRVFNFAAESHVDNSISNPRIFIDTNVTGTFNLLLACRQYFESLLDKSNFRFLHVSTDEVYGTLQLGDGKKFDENTPYAPNSPYSASKAASDHIVRSFVHTYGLPCVTTNCSNNYGPRQHIEKLIPKTIMACKNEQKIPVYGNGTAVRDWIWVDDHCAGVLLAMEKGKIGETYCFGGDCEKNTLEVVQAICKAMNEIFPRKQGKYEDLITFVKDRAGHDIRYSVSSEKAKKELGFKHSVTDFKLAIDKIVSMLV